VPALPDVRLSLVLSVATAIAEMSTESSIIDLLYDMLDQQPGNVYILERIIEAWESKNERGMMN
jgi:ABC-type transport system involved in Fe-S cluster assembly fused permease/ATPase subunit